MFHDVLPDCEEDHLEVLERYYSHHPLALKLERLHSLDTVLSMLRSDNIQLECTYAYSDYAQSPLNDDRSLLAQHRIKGRLPQVRLLVQSDFQPAANLDYV